METTGNPQAFPQGEVAQDDDGSQDQLSLCDACGASVYVALVRLTGGARRYLPVDMVPWTGSRTALRLARSPEDGWYVDPFSGPWQEHACERSQAL